MGARHNRIVVVKLDIEMLFERFSLITMVVALLAMVLIHMMHTEKPVKEIPVTSSICHEGAELCLFHASDNSALV